MSSQISQTNDVADVVEKGFIAKWLVCGPFSTGEDVYRLYRMGRLEVPRQDPTGGELEIEPSPGVSHRSDALPDARAEWSPTEMNSPRVNLTSLFRGVKSGIGYAAAYLDSDSDRTMVCEFQPRTVGELIVNHERLSPDRGLVQIHLREGRNLILVKLMGEAERGSMWEAVLSLRDAITVADTGLAATGLVFRGFYRGSADDPQIEAEFAVANTLDRDIHEVSARIETDQGKGTSEDIGVVRSRETRLIRTGVPVVKGSSRAIEMDLEVHSGTGSGRIHSTIEDVDPPGRDATIFMGAGFHCDPVWTNTQAMYNDISLSNVRQYLEFCRADPDFKVVLHELDYLKPYLDFFPSDRDYLVKMMKAGRALPGGSYCQANEKNVSGEQLIRNILYGKLFAESQFGVTPDLYHAWDVFGHVPQLSQILDKSGDIGVVWSKKVKGFPPLFRYISLDGTELLHRRVDYSFSTGSFDEMRERAYTCLKEMQSLGHDFDLRMDCTDFKPPTAWRLGRCREMKSLLPSIELANPADFFQSILESDSFSEVPTTSRDATQYHIGTSQSRIELKIANRLGETSLYNGELLSTLASTMGKVYPDLQLDKAWRQLLFNSHHDAITGTSCDISYLDMMQGYREALDLSANVLESALEFIAARVETENSNGVPLVIFNTLNWTRTGIVRAKVNFEHPAASFEVRDPDGETLPFRVLDRKEPDGGIRSATIEFLARDVPSVGYAVYTVVGSEAELPEWSSREGPVEIENEHYRIAVDPERGGGVSSILDKDAAKEVVDQDHDLLANEIGLLKEDHDRHEPSWEVYTTGERMFSGSYPAKVTVSRCGGTQRIRARSALGERCEIVRDIMLQDGLKRIDFRTEILGYDGEDDLFVVLFPTQIEGGSPTYEERFGAITKHRGRRFLDYRTWRDNAYSDCSIHSSQNFFDLGSTTKIRFVDSDVRTIASRNLGSVAVVMTHSDQVRGRCSRLQVALAKRGVLTTPWFDDDDSARREPLTHLDSTEAGEKNQDLANCDFRISVGISGTNSYSRSLLEGVEESRRENFQGRVERLGFDFLVTLDSNLPEGWDPIPVLILEAKDEQHLEESIDFLADGLQIGDLILPAHANDLGGSEVEDYGLSILNNGNMANTVEPDGTMTLLLKHSANWSRKHLDEEFVPERKDHVFHYALYPHRGSWRDARSYRKGWEYNVPLLCVQTDIHHGQLPPEHSFLKVSSENVVVSAFKPIGNPVASFSSERSDVNKGMLIRMYETEGRPTRTRLEFSIPIEAAFRMDLMENRHEAIDLEDGDSLVLDIGPFAIETIGVSPSLEVEQIPAAEEPREVVQPVYSKYWKENLGPAPIGYQPVAVSIQGSPVNEAGGRGTTLNEVSIVIVNNYTDRTISGRAVVDAPSGWVLEPGYVDYRVPPRGCESYAVAFSFAGIRRTGLFRVRLEHDGQIYEDVIEIGEQSKLTYTGGGSVYQDVLKTQVEKSLEFKIYPREDGVSVRLENPYNEAVDGGVALISPLETWSEREVGRYSMVEMTPSVRDFHLSPRGHEVLVFRFERDNPHFWAYLKLFYMGRTVYRRVK